MPHKHSACLFAYFTVSCTCTVFRASDKSGAVCVCARVMIAVHHSSCLARSRALVLRALSTSLVWLAWQVWLAQQTGVTGAVYSTVYSTATWLMYSVPYSTATCMPSIMWSLASSRISTRYTINQFSPRAGRIFTLLCQGIKAGALHSLAQTTYHQFWIPWYHQRTRRMKRDTALPANHKSTRESSAPESVNAVPYSVSQPIKHTEDKHRYTLLLWPRME